MCAAFVSLASAKSGWKSFFACGFFDERERVVVFVEIDNFGAL